MSLKLEEKTVKSKRVYKGKILDFYVDDIVSANGTEAIREYSKHIFSVGAVIKINDRYVLERQYRYPLHDVILEIPAGKAEEGETPLEAVKREVLEETGCGMKMIKELGTFHPAAAYSNELMYLFYAEVDTRGDTHFDKDEAIEIVTYSKPEIIKLLKDNTITDSKTIIAFARLFKIC